VRANRRARPASRVSPEQLTPEQRRRVERLCEKHRNEDIHTRHVTALALQLFDAARRRASLPGRGRALLEAAALLHDVGYAAQPAGHALRSATILLEAGRGAWPAAEARAIAAVIVLHSGPLDEALALARDRGLPLDAGVLKLAALLRVADGLDHGHMQDARIESIRYRGGALTVVVRSPWYPENIRQAMDKADLWSRAMGPGLRIQAAAVRPADRALEALPVREAMRRFLLLEHRAMADLLPEAQRGNADALHEYRCAARRARTLLQVFGRKLDAPSAPVVERKLAAVREAVAAARDMAVRLKLLRDICADARGTPRHTAFLAGQQREHDRALARATTFLAGRRALALRWTFGRLVRSELGRAAAGDDRPFGAYARRKMRKAVEAAEKQARRARSKDAETLHRLRIRLRRARHLMELMGELAPQRARKQAQRLHEAERLLGKVHDADLARAAIATARTRAPKDVVLALCRLRRKRLRQFRAAWARVDLRALARKL
jgi:CHAD domain-containing protein